MNSSQKKKINVFGILKIFVSITLITIIVSNLKLESLLLLFKHGNLSNMISGMIIWILSFIFIQSARTHILLKEYTGSFMMTTRLTLISSFWGNLIPTNSGGDIVKIMILKKNGIKDWHNPMILIFMERVVGFVFFFVGIVWYLLFYGDPHGVLNQILVNEYILLISAILLLSLSFIIIVFLYYNEKINIFRKNFYAGVRMIPFKNYPRLIIWTFFFQGTRLFSLFLFVSCYSQTVNLSDLFFILCLVAIIGLLPVSVGGYGVREGAFAGSLILLGLSQPDAISISFLIGALTLLISLIGGFITLVDRRI